MFGDMEAAHDDPGRRQCFLYRMAETFVHIDINLSDTGLLPDRQCFQKSFNRALPSDLLRPPIRTFRAWPSNPRWSRQNPDGLFSRQFHRCPGSPTPARSTSLSAVQCDDRFGTCPSRESVKRMVDSLTEETDRRRVLLDADYVWSGLIGNWGAGQTTFASVRLVPRIEPSTTMLRNGYAGGYARNIRFEAWGGSVTRINTSTNSWVWSICHHEPITFCERKHECLSESPVP